MKKSGHFLFVTTDRHLGSNAIEMLRLYFESSLAGYLDKGSVLVYTEKRGLVCECTVECTLGVVCSIHPRWQSGLTNKKASKSVVSVSGNGLSYNSNSKI